MIYFAKWKIALVLAVCLAGLAFAAPNLVPRETAESLPGWLPRKQVNLGLDLQGGSHLLLEVDSAAVVRELMESVVDSIRVELRQARIRYTGLGVVGAAAEVTIAEPERLDEARRLIGDIAADSTVEVREDARIVVALTEQALRERERSAVAKTVEIIRRRIDQTGVREPTIVPQGVDRILVQLPGIDDPEQMKRILGKTAQMSFHLVDEETPLSEALAGRVPPASRLLPLDEERTTSGREPMILVRKRVVVSGEHLIDAQPTFDSQSGLPVVNFRFDTLGAKLFGDATSKNVGRRLAIVLDNRVISAPVIRDAILGGSGIITGNFTVGETNELALLLRAGALPAPLTILEERTVGPELGADSIAAGEVAGVVALVVVIAFMVLAYGLFGLMAIGALIMNLVLILAALSVLQATLTLPGIAGIVLTIGMAVDANVLVFERIREEVRGGRTPISAIDAGYSRAMATIIDANVTTLIAAVLLYVFGSGPVQGFAVTLAIGICTSMFSAVLLTRLGVVTWLLKTRPQALPI